MITREDVQDLQPGDVVELEFQFLPSPEDNNATPLTLRGPYPAVVNFFDNWLGGVHTLTVVSRAPRPLYINSDRTEPVPGDVVRDPDDEGRLTWRWCLPGLWVDSVGARSELDSLRQRHRLRLLVDGETGQVVP